MGYLDYQPWQASLPSSADYGLSLGSMGITAPNFDLPPMFDYHLPTEEELAKAKEDEFNSGLENKNKDIEKLKTDKATMSAKAEKNKAKKQELQDKKSKLDGTGATKPEEKVGFWHGVKTIGKGFLKRATSMFTDENGDFSIKQTVKTVAIAAVVAVAVAGAEALTGGLATPALLALGGALAAKDIGEGAYRVATSSNKKDTEKGLEEIGGGLFDAATTAVGVKGVTAASGARAAEAAGAVEKAVMLTKTSSNSAKLSTESEGILNIALVDCKQGKFRSAQKLEALLKDPTYSEVNSNLNAGKKVFIDAASKSQFETVKTYLGSALPDGEQKTKTIQLIDQISSAIERGDKEAYKAAYKELQVIADKSPMTKFTLSKFAKDSNRFGMSVKPMQNKTSNYILNAKLAPVSTFVKTAAGMTSLNNLIDARVDGILEGAEAENKQKEIAGLSTVIDSLEASNNKTFQDLDDNAKAHAEALNDKFTFLKSRADELKLDTKEVELKDDDNADAIEGKIKKLEDAIAEAKKQKEAKVADAAPASTAPVDGASTPESGDTKKS